MVLPASSAPAARSFSTAGADRVAGACVRSQSGLPPPVMWPATSIRSLTAKSRPPSRPVLVGCKVARGPGTNAPMSVSIGRGMVSAAVTSTGALAERSNDGRGISDEAKAFFHIPDRGLGAEIRRGGGAAIFNQDAAVTEEISISQRMHDALIGVDAGEQDRPDAKIAQDAIERCVPKAADAILVDLDVLLLLRQFVDNSRGPGVFLQHARAAAGQGIAEADARAFRPVEVDLVRRHVGEIRPVAPVDPDHGDAGLAQRGQQILQGLDRLAVRTVVAANVIDPTALGAEIVLHVDHDDRGA